MNTTETKVTAISNYPYAHAFPGTVQFDAQRHPIDAGKALCGTRVRQASGWFAAAEVTCPKCLAKVDAL